eukprot:7052173-Alexandrium_andersonii.AAC.1
MGSLAEPPRPCRLLRPCRSRWSLPQTRAQLFFMNASKVFAGGASTAGASGSPSAAAVSYTHLTLPTICSV